ncbi:MAG: NFACT family protein [Candidatus Micrarchaeia archaeon]
MRELASVELSVIALELKALEGLYLKKLYDMGNGAFELFFSSNAKEYAVYCKLLRSINITSYIAEHETATAFAISARKRLLGKKLVEVKQLDGDRILLFDFSDYKLFVEMLGKGNVVLTDKDDVIIEAYTRVRYKDRSIEPKALYAKPKGSAIGVSEINERNAEERVLSISSENDRIISLLSRLFEIGPLYIEDVLIRNNIDPKAKANAIEKDTLRRVAEGIANFRNVLSNYKPRVYYNDSEGNKDYSIIEIAKYKGYYEKSYATLSELLDDFYLKERQERQENESDKSREKELLSIKSSIEKQKEFIKTLEYDEQDAKKKGDIIFANMNQINQIIDYARKAKKFTLEDLKGFETGEIKVIDVDLKNKRIRIKIKG